MNSTPSTPKELADTSASFFHAPTFQYRSQETAIDFVLMRDRQKQRVLDAFRSDSTFNEEKLIAQLERVEEESNQFIQSLLQELADQCKRTRMIQAEFDSVIREKNTEARRLAEQSLDTAAKAQVDRNRWEQEREVLQKEARQAKQALKSVHKECQGLRQLLDEYQNELQAANAKIEQLFKESAQGTHMIEMMTEKLEKLTLQLSDSEEKYQCAIEGLKSLKSQLKSSQEDYERAQKTLCDYKAVEERNRALQQQCNELRQNQSEQTAMLEYLERKLLQTNGQVMRQESKCLSIQAASSMDIQQLINKENQWKAALQDVETKAKLGMSKLKESYERKMRKIVTYFQKEVKDLKQSCNFMKESLQKQMLLFFKLTQRDIRESQMTFKEKNRGKDLTIDRKRSRCVLEPMLQN